VTARLKDARAAFRREKAMEDIQRIVNSRAAGSTGDDMVFRLHPGNIVSRIEEKAANDPLFRGSFAPGELEALVEDFRRLGNLPRVPTTAPTLKDVGPLPETPVPRTLTSLRSSAPTPTEPTLPPTLSSLGKHFLMGLGPVGGAAAYFGPGVATKVAGAATAIDTADAVLSRLLMTGPGRAWLKSQLAADGTISREALLRGLAAGRAATDLTESAPATR
jgi:hypothetical protein